MVILPQQVSLTPPHEKHFSCLRSTLSFPQQTEMVFVHPSTPGLSLCMNIHGITEPSERTSCSRDTSLCLLTARVICPHPSEVMCLEIILVATHGGWCRHTVSSSHSYWSHTDHKKRPQK